MLNYPPKKRFRALQRRMLGECTQKELAKEIGRSPTYLTLRFTGKEPWDIRDMDKIGERLGIPRRDFPLFFWDDEPALAMLRARGLEVRY